MTQGSIVADISAARRRLCDEALSLMIEEGILVFQAAGIGSLPRENSHG
jgi:hypothetical protein